MCINTGLRSIKLHANRYEPAHGCGRLFRQDTHGCLITQTGPGGDGVLEVQFWAIIGTQRHSEATLGIACIAFPKLPLGEEGHAQVRGQAQCNQETRDATSYDADIVSLALSHHVFSLSVSVFYT